jgi:predicted ATP-binding protein involved in virulence
MADSQFAQIKELEEAIRELIRQNAEMREEVKNTKDLTLRKTLLDAADECEAAARKLEDGLRGMREGLH